MFYITLCGTITPCAFKFGDPRENSLFVAVLTSDCNFFLLEDFFPCVYVPGSAGVGAWSFQGNILDDKFQSNGVFRGDGRFLLAGTVADGPVIDGLQQEPGDVPVQELVHCAGQPQVLSFRRRCFQVNMESVRHICKIKSFGSWENQRVTQRQSLITRSSKTCRMVPMHILSAAALKWPVTFLF